MSLTIASACIGRVDVTRQFVDTTIANCSEPHEFILVSNGSTDAENEELYNLDLGGWDYSVLVHDSPLGTSRAFNTGIREASGDLVVVLQNDLLILEPGWDLRLQSFFDRTPQAGVVGFAGGKGLGRSDLYVAPYELHQLARNRVFTSLVDWQIHGSQTVEATPVVVLDGIAMAMRRSDWEAWGGYDEQWAHHCYDLDLSLAAHFSGKTNYVVPVLCQHLNGQSTGTEVYAKWAAPQGGDQGIHAQSHRIFYEKWRGKLPVSVP